MPFKMGDLNFTGQASTLTTSSSGSTIGDVMVGDKYIYVVHRSLDTIGVYNKNDDGTIGTYVRNVNWYANDNVISYICLSNSSVPYSYAVYTENEQDYLIGWSSSHNALFGWTISKTNQALSDRRMYSVCDRTNAAYSRGGWDGGQYIYFWNRANMGLYRWDLREKTKAMDLMCIIASNGLSLDSSYTGSGLLVTNNKAYWGSGSNESDGLLGCFNANTGAVIQGVMRQGNLGSFGVTPISGDAGCIQMNPTNRGLAYYFTAGNVIKTLFQSTVVATNINIETIQHGLDIPLSFDLVQESGALSSSSASWRVEVNGVIVKDYATLLPLPVTNLSIVLPNSMFKIGANVVTISSKDNYGAVSQKIIEVTITNNQPVIVTSVSKSTIHDEKTIFEANVTDEVTDLMTYRILVNDVVYSDWTVSGYTSPLVVRRAFRADELRIGRNEISIEVKDNFKTNTSSVIGTSVVTKVNSAPTATAMLKGSTLTMTFDDADGDDIRYRVLLNGEQILPESGFSIAFHSPLTTTYTLPRKKVRTNQPNAITVEVIDTAGDTGTWTFNGVLGYSGLMFKDTKSEYYTTDVGVLLKYLDVGVLYAREQSGIFEVGMENTLGYPVKNVKLSVIQGDLDPITEKVEICNTNAPFIPQSEFIYPEVFNTGDSFKFYLRLSLNNDAVGGGVFKIKVTGDAL
ncbi:hypothetical protein A8L34_16195 [Bacillus sp. FJAT-27264]|uniref:hypothetical protein n=1 Tax=Paenibacillus sp. (strain DSM 101736 / FJAT-27264) TaxID=1850362 RepID=UPI000807DE92|nr:hypothetical protein [Bacillus sp. FJAT-27264]OBZ11862.1 hypothetical protein A8L34_16195 [Bacillus sp. FJAT-27264]